MDKDRRDIIEEEKARKGLVKEALIKSCRQLVKAIEDRSSPIGGAYKEGDIVESGSGDRAAALDGKSKTGGPVK
jgi:hypothetical protein